MVNNVSLESLEAYDEINYENYIRLLTHQDNNKKIELLEDIKARRSKQGNNMQYELQSSNGIGS